MRRAAVLLTTVAVVAALPAVALAAPPERFDFEGETATAFWVMEDEETIRFTDAFLNVGNFTFDGEVFEQATLDFFMGEFGPDGFTDVFGFAELSPDQYELNAQGGTFVAAVTAELELFGQQCTFDGGPFPDCVEIGPFLVTVAIEWDETSGRIYPSSFIGRSHSPFSFDVFSSRSWGRPTTASGELSGDVSMVLGPSEQASISRDSSSDRFHISLGTAAGRSPAAAF